MYNKEFKINGKIQSCYIYNESALEMPSVAKNTVNVILTSPPYFGQRLYLDSKDAMIAEEIGREKKLEDYLSNLQEVFLNLHSVLVDDGVFWLNVGFIGNKQGNLIDLPSLVKDQALAAGFKLKNIIIFKKINAQPNGVKHRSSIDHEMLYMLTKVSGTNYFYDQEGYLEFANPESMLRKLRGISGDHKYKNGSPGQVINSMNKPRQYDANRSVELYGYARNVWEFATKNFNAKKFNANIDHYAVMPLALVNRVLDLSLSTYGRCAGCKTQIRTNYEKKVLGREELNDKELDCLKIDKRLDRINNFLVKRKNSFNVKCSNCQLDLPIPKNIESPVVFDPFSGAATTLLGGMLHNANCLGLEINRNFIDLSAKRLEYEIINRSENLLKK